VFTISISNRQTTLEVDEDRLKEVTRSILTDHDVEQAEISIAVVDDDSIHQINLQFLNHDYSTDVLSFPLERDGNRLVGEVIVSADTAKTDSNRFGWSPADELLLYVIHGMLHLVGYDDVDREKRRQIRAQEARYLAKFDLSPRWDIIDSTKDSMVSYSKPPQEEQTSREP